MANEKRLIDANAFKMYLEQIRQEYLEEDTYSSNFAANVIETVQDEYLANAPTVDAVEVVQKPLRVEISTDDFTNKDLAKEKGYYRKHYFCPSCDIEIGHKTFDKNRQFGQGTVLHSNEFPNYCPHCGAKMDGERKDNEMDKC